MRFSDRLPVQIQSLPASRCASIAVSPPLLFRNRLCTNRNALRISRFTVGIECARGSGWSRTFRWRSWRHAPSLPDASFLAPAPLAAQIPAPDAQRQASRPPQPPAYSANRGHWDFGAQVGYSMEYGLDWHEVSHIQMLIAQPQIGFIVRDFQRSPVRRFEIIDEGILGGAVHPPRPTWPVMR